MDTALQRQLGDKFRLHRDELATLLTASADSDHDLAPGFAAFARRSERIAPIAAKLGALDIAIPALAESLAHMHVNRMLASMQRRQELVLYDLLRRHYDGVRARAKK
jgi:thiopeptide-type bacteriocin biosynthesis protein